MILSNRVRSVNAVEYASELKWIQKENIILCIETKIEVSETIVEANSRYFAAPRFYNVSLLYLRGIKCEKTYFMMFVETQTQLAMRIKL